ncbi:response regulator transcription factor [Micromonospora craniellae]|uniref:DNA-binding response regulator n=2 Tax=Micromonospora craniellae TaxID=2294034 RepID=A0A372FQV3_9ACTN|nr:response regulator transcription factor [Micromonospora craniellae]QOC94768.1 response regulator transcription factor [Micromonospora craniellae]RFS41000.1 DNA-binding response regulator [Micromonospora craniellae]
MRVAVVEDSALFREGLIMLLRAAGFDVVGWATNGEDALDLLDGARADVAILDIRMSPEPEGGLATAATVRQRHPDVGVLLLSNYAESHYLMRMLKIGTERIGYRLKDRIVNVEALGDTLRRVAEGEVVIEPEIAQQLVNQLPGAGAGDGDGLRRLTSREMDVLRLMAEGRSNAGIADALFLSTKTVEKHAASIFAKLGLSADIAAYHRRVLAVISYLRARQIEG